MRGFSPSSSPPVQDRHPCQDPSGSHALPHPRTHQKNDPGRQHRLEERRRGERSCTCVRASSTCHSISSTSSFCSETLAAASSFRTFLRCTSSTSLSRCLLPFVTKVSTVSLVLLVHRSRSWDLLPNHANNIFAQFQSWCAPEAAAKEGATRCPVALGFRGPWWDHRRSGGRRRAPHCSPKMPFVWPAFLGRKHHTSPLSRNYRTGPSGWAPSHHHSAVVVVVLTWP